TDEQRQNSLMNALGIAGVAGAAKVADKMANGTKFIPYSKEFVQNQVQKAQDSIKDMGKAIGKVEVPTGVKVRTVADTTGNTYKAIGVDKTSIKDLAQKITAKGEGFSVSSKLQDIRRISEIEVNFKQNPKHNTEEFVRQLKDQEKGLNDLTVEEYLNNRKRYLEEGRAIEGNAAQRAEREKQLSKKIKELRREGLSRNEAEGQAEKWMKTQAALHNPDQIAGGNPRNIGGMGDRKINSSLGSQWKYRIDVVDEQIRESSKNMTETARKSTYLNVKLIH
ncbi:MAG: polymorphic toxin type 15 domain-containing protein, partial [Rummeliibacillus sp.]